MGMRAEQAIWFGPSSSSSFFTKNEMMMDTRTVGQEEGGTTIERSSAPIDNYLASHITCAVLAHHATSLGDTLASEFGILQTRSPILVTKPWRTVPPGTNGGVTILGTVWSIVGGALVGLSVVAMDYLSGIEQVPKDLPVGMPLLIVGYGAVCGFAGSLIDSIAGALLQASYWDPERKRVLHGKSRSRPIAAENDMSCTTSAKGHHDERTLISGYDILNNEQVNFVSVLLTTFIGGWVIAPWFFSNVCSSQRCEMWERALRL